MPEQGRVYKELWWADQELNKVAKPRQGRDPKQVLGVQGNEKVDIQVTDLGSYLQERSE